MYVGGNGLVIRSWLSAVVLHRELPQQPACHRLGFVAALVAAFVGRRVRLNELLEPPGWAHEAPQPRRAVAHRLREDALIKVKREPQHDARLEHGDDCKDEVPQEEHLEPEHLATYGQEALQGGARDLDG
jgi:hypothetical protein